MKMRILFSINREILMVRALLYFLLVFIPIAANGTSIGSYYIPGLVIDENNGLFVKMHREVMRRSGVKAELIIQPTKRTQRAFAYGKIDAYFPELVENLPKKELIVSKPFWLKKIILFSLVNSDIRDLSDLEGKIVGAVQGYSYGEKIVNNPNISLTYVKDDNANIERLRRGYIDAVIGDDNSTITAVENSQYSHLIHYDQEKPVHVLEVFYVCQKTSSGSELCKSINQALSDMKDQGIIKLNRTTGKAEIMF
jgi:ABC-type amino acid transport substrate-binding protein